MNEDDVHQAAQRHRPGVSVALFAAAHRGQYRELPRFGI